MGDIVLAAGVIEDAINGKLCLPECDCWLKLEGWPRRYERAGRRGEEIPEWTNYKAGGKHVGKPTITLDGDGLDVGWNPGPYVWFQSQPIFRKDMSKEKPPAQIAHSGVLYTKEPTVRRIARIDLGGPFDMRHGNMTIRLKEYPRPINWWRRLFKTLFSGGVFSK